MFKNVKAAPGIVAQIRAHTPLGLIFYRKVYLMGKMMGRSGPLLKNTI